MMGVIKPRNFIGTALAIAMITSVIMFLPLLFHPVFAATAAGKMNLNLSRRY